MPSLQDIFKGLPTANQEALQTPTASLPGLANILSWALGIPSQAIQSNTQGPLQTMFGTEAGAGLSHALGDVLPMFMGAPNESMLNRLAAQYNYVDAAAMRQAARPSPSSYLDKLLPPKAEMQAPIKFDPNIPPEHQEIFQRAMNRSASRHPGLFGQVGNIKVGEMKSPDALGTTTGNWRFMAIPRKGALVGPVRLEFKPSLATEEPISTFFGSASKDALKRGGLEEWSKLTPEEMLQAVIEHETAHVGQNVMANRGLKPLATNYFYPGWEPPAYRRQFDLLRDLLKQRNLGPQFSQDVLNRLFRK